jgi:hypothetical protein
MFIPMDSPLRNPPDSFSRQQILFLDGIRYSAEMIRIAYERLWTQLEPISVPPPDDTPITTDDIARAMLDAWSIIDSANRLRDLLSELPGLPNSSSWRRIFLANTEEADGLRNAVQHPLGEIGKSLAEVGQLWGFLSWAQVREGKYTGKWLMMSAGATFVGDEFLFIGPNKLPFTVPIGRVCLSAFGKRVYLGRILQEVVYAVISLVEDIGNGVIRTRSKPAIGRRGGDEVAAGMVEVLVSNS